MLQPLLLKRIVTILLLFLISTCLLKTSVSNANDDTVVRNSDFANNDGPATVVDPPEDEEHESFEVGKVLPVDVDILTKSSSERSNKESSASSILNLSTILLVSTIDGKISAISLSPSAGSSPLKWQFDLGKPLLSQSISQLLHRDSSGQPYRIIPSLDGSLFRLDAGSLHSLPVTADTLLSTSYRLAEDTFVVGSKETLLTGLALRTGQPLYQCGASGCQNLSPEAPTGQSSSRHRLDDGLIDGEENDDDDGDDDSASSSAHDAVGGVLTVRRLASTVRAVHSSGREDWHFQVAECELSYHACAGHSDDGTGGGGNDSDSQARRFCGHQSGGPATSASERQRHQNQQQKPESDSDRSAAAQGLRFDVTSGIVYRVDLATGATLWREALSSPIAQAWELTPGRSRLTPISVFHMRGEQAAVSSGGGGGGCPSRGSQLPPPLSGGQVYIGQYRDQYYVQSQQHGQHQDQHQQHQSQLAVSAPNVHSAWRRPSPAPLQVLLEFKPQKQQEASPDDEAGQSRELAVREDLPVAEPGFYPAVSWDDGSGPGLSSEHSPHQPHAYGQHSTSGEDLVGEFDDDDDGVVYQVINNYTGSLWHYMPQIIILSLFLSVLVHLFVTKVLHRARYDQLNRACSVESNASSSITLVGVQRDALLAAPPQQQQLTAGAGSSASIAGSSSQQPSLLALPSYLPGLGGQFVSRYHTEFTHVRCLGRGGFGLVFEARHRIDDCSYAIKRVAVRNSDQARARILREVKALAKLDHQGIVRYYQAWFECPPCGWQERMDTSLLSANRAAADATDAQAVMDDALSSGGPDTVASFGLSADFTASKIALPASSRNANYLRHRRKRLFSDSFAATSTATKNASPVGSSALLDHQRRRHGTGGGSISSCCGRRPSPLNPFDGDVDLSATDEEDEKVKAKRVADKDQSEGLTIDSADFNDAFDSGEFSRTASLGGSGLGTRWTMQEGDTTADEPSTGLSDLLDKRPAGKDHHRHHHGQTKSSKNRTERPSNHISVEDDSVEIVFEDSNPGAAYNRLSSSSSEPGLKSSDDDDDGDGAATNTQATAASVLAIDNNDCTNDGVYMRRRRKTTNASAAALTSQQPTPVYESKLYLYIQMQLCQKESLRDWLRANTGERDRARVRDVFTQICQAVSFVHQCNLIHRDLKSSNIFFALDGSVKIGDFGLATALMDEEAAAAAAAAESAVAAAASGAGEEPPHSRLHSAQSAAAAAAATWHTSEIGTRLYMSPEQSAGLAYNEKVDIFSLGLILFELCHAFTTEMERVTCMLRAKESRLPARFEAEWPAEAAIILRLLSPNPSARPSADEILRDPLLAPPIVASPDDLEGGAADEGVANRVGRSRTSSSQSSMRSAAGQQQLLQYRL